MFRKISRVVSLCSLMILAVANAARATVVETDLTLLSQLDLTGTFVEAQNIGGGSQVVGGSFTFAAGTRFTGTGTLASGQLNGATDDPGLNTVLDSLNYGRPLSAEAITMPAGSSYKLQLLFSDPNTRGIDDITVEGNATYNFDAHLQTISGKSALITVTGTVGVDGDVDIVIAHNDALSVSTYGTYGSDFAILSGFTLENTTVATPEPASASLLLFGCCGVVAARRASKRRSR